MKLDIDKLITIDQTGMPKAPNPRQLLDKDILMLYTRDNTPDKRKYIAECGVIYYLGDPKSPCRQRGLSDEESLREAIENFDLDVSYTPDDLVKRLIKRYYKQNITEAGVTIENLQKAFHVANLTINKALEYLNNKLRGVLADGDIPIIMNLQNQLSNQVKAVPDMIKALNQAYDNLRSEEEIKMARGGVQILSSMDADEDDD
jgi:hypothetical protein